MVRLKVTMCGFFNSCFFKVEQLLLCETKHLTVKTGAPMLVSAEVLLQNRCVGFGKKHLALQQSK